MPSQAQGALIHENRKNIIRLPHIVDPTWRLRAGSIDMVAIEEQQLAFEAKAPIVLSPAVDVHEDGVVATAAVVVHPSARTRPLRGVAGEGKTVALVAPLEV
jgi:hypothetical protein